jgi:acyl dehydratase
MVIAARTSRLPAHIGEMFTRRLRLSEAEIRAFATSVHDFNPLHHDHAVAHAAGYPGLIASGTQVGSHLMALTATHFAQPLADGTPRNGLGVGFDIRFRAVVLADEDIELRWTVTSVERKERLAGWITLLEGDASSARGVLLSATGTLLLRLGALEPASGRALAARAG